ncbi:MAG: hypothetical protein ABI041_08030 [Bdellovibrionia bacterium]
MKFNSVLSLILFLPSLAFAGASLNCDLTQDETHLVSHEVKMESSSCLHDGEFFIWEGNTYHSLSILIKGEGDAPKNVEVYVNPKGEWPEELGSGVATFPVSKLDEPSHYRTQINVPIGNGKILSYVLSCQNSVN